MSIHQIKKYKTIKDKNRNKIQVAKTEKEWNKETKNGTATFYFSARYIINKKTKQYKSGVFSLKREAKDEERLFLNDPLEYIKTNSKRAKINVLDAIENSSDKNLNEYFNDFINLEMQHNRESTAYGHLKIWNKHFSEEIGDLFSKDITLSLTQQIHENLNIKINSRTNTLYATSTKNTFHSTLVDFYDYLYKNGKIEINYAKVVGQFKSPNINKNENQKIKYQTEEQFNLFMSIVDDPYWYHFFNFLFWHGCRKGEQRALRIKNINLKYSTIIFNKTFSRNRNGGEMIGAIKNGKKRNIYLARQSKKNIENLINFYKHMDGFSEEWFLFGGSIAINKNRIEDKLKYYYKKLQEKYPNREIIALTHHEFGRHSHASYLLNEGLKKGLSIEEIYAIIAQRLGDSIDVIKRTYAHLYEEESNDKAKNILN